MFIIFNMHQRKELFTSHHQLKHHIHHIHILHTMSSLSNSYSLKNSLLLCIFYTYILHTLYFNTFQYAQQQRIVHLTALLQSLSHHIHMYLIFVPLPYAQIFFALVHIFTQSYLYTILTHPSICTSANNLSLHTIYSNITYIIYTYFILCHLCHTHTHSKALCCCAYLLC